MNECIKDNRGSCGTTLPSTCVGYTGGILTSFDMSSLPNNPNINDIFKSLDTLIKTINTSINTTGYDKMCLGNNVSCEHLTIRQILDLITQQFCLLKSKVDVLQQKVDNIPNTIVSIDLSCLSDKCAPTDITIQNVLQELVNEICNLKNNK